MSLIRKKDGSDVRALLTEQDYAEFTDQVREGVEASGADPDTFISHSGKVRIAKMLRDVIEPAKRHGRFVLLANVTGMERLHDRNACTLVERAFDTVAKARDDLDVDTTCEKPKSRPGAIGHPMIDMWLCSESRGSGRGV